MSSSVGVETPWLQTPLFGDWAATLELNRSTITLTLLLVVVVPVVASALLGSKGSRLPVVNVPGPFQLEIQKKFEFVQDGMKFLREGRQRFPGKPFVLVTNSGRITIMPPDRAQEIKGLSTLCFRKAFCFVAPLMPGLGTLEIIDHPNELVQKVVTKHLTKRLNTVTEPLAIETSFAVSKSLGEKNDWAEVTIYEALLDIVARISTRVFLGPDICRDEAWLEITKNFTVAQSRSLATMKLFPYYLRPLVYFLDPNGRKTVRLFYEARKMVEPLVARRRRERQEPGAPAYNDAIEWADLECGGQPFDATDFQLALASVAIHTTTDLVSKTLMHLAAGDPENIEALRQEMIDVLPANGWKKTSLTRMILLDSAIKEAQRMKPILMTNMLRKATADTKLEGGIVLRKGEMLAVDAGNLHDPAVYENPDVYDMRRFANMRSSGGGMEHRAHLVSAVPEHITFGYGKHVCPGRFFAANEIKMALCHLLMNYDWKIAPGTTLEPTWVGTDMLFNQQAKMLCRSRRAEFDLDSLEVDDTE
ncbi:hypothetical protein MAPG_11479 [Magnaporthiopsis poae ATCC 64411]|uniref:Ent-kaurene oxidase n=1 Tax=Magnaporthiopsis poae (strain ATCC 64411 / 73-15) TaxID=644358 RepID=A0A0C4EFD6_MAGP6|nr:hypothetical protein MAPG_11479 [Magnaporthiopsis poae ATCC 64411]